MAAPATSGRWRFGHAPSSSDQLAGAPDSAIGSAGGHQTGAERATRAGSCPGPGATRAAGTLSDLRVPALFGEALVSQSDRRTGPAAGSASRTLVSEEPQSNAAAVRVGRRSTGASLVGWVMEDSNIATVMLGPSGLPHVWLDRATLVTTAGSKRSASDRCQRPTGQSHARAAALPHPISGPSGTTRPSTSRWRTCRQTWSCRCPREECLCPWGR